MTSSSSPAHNKKIIWMVLCVCSAMYQRCDSLIIKLRKLKALVQWPSASLKTTLCYADVNALSPEEICCLGFEVMMLSTVRYSVGYFRIPLNWSSPLSWCSYIRQWITCDRLTRCITDTPLRLSAAPTESCIVFSVDVPWLVLSACTTFVRKHYLRYIL